jgi:hypothetical protein
MALKNSMLINEQIILPIKDMNVAKIPPLNVATTSENGKYVFLYDYEKAIFSLEAEQIMNQKGIGVPYNLPKESFYNLKFSKGDVVDVVDFRKYNNDKGVPVVDKKVMLINVPKYVTPIGGLKGFKPTVEVNNYDGFLQKVVESTPLTLKLGQNFGKNLNPKFKPVYDNPATPTPTPTGTTTTPVIVNGLEDTTETKSFFDDKNNLLMIAGVLLIGYLLLNDKSE